MPSPRRICTVDGCLRHASPRNSWCAWHRKHYKSIVQRSELQRPADHDLLPTGMTVDQAGMLELLGGVRLAAPPNLSLSYYFSDLVNSRMQLLLPASRLRVHLESLREHLAKRGTT
jgi:hypothetical protein